MLEQVIRGPPSNPVSNALGRGLFQSRVLYALGTQGVVLDISQVSQELLIIRLIQDSKDMSSLHCYFFALS